MYPQPRWFMNRELWVSYQLLAESLMTATWRHYYITICNQTWKDRYIFFCWYVGVPICLKINQDFYNKMFEHLVLSCKTKLLVNFLCYYLIQYYRTDRVTWTSSSCKAVEFSMWMTLFYLRCKYKIDIQDLRSSKTCSVWSLYIQFSNLKSYQPVGSCFHILYGSK